ncbi:CMP-N-acetylneuraminate-beta-galactosamide-alpha-2,3-sialyltransferase 1-like [Poecilia reticulata]|uniref:CMP-N-acetylneuraminate-beta-galactosamide- alpha-2,3-sialyltransferase 1-like n=1 Tax=Poecilia reticulata TaxID=8081 RepID=UPI0004A3D888|nr:PREDICTED: CMP-N-acetylneuraminate-beta-galactosamide-alpha-2,3-sialyltransferase 1-like [Poecilia reticulata]
MAAVSVLWSSDFSRKLQLQLKNQSTCPCERCFSKNDVLLRKHMRRSIEPFLTANTKLSEEDFKWWKHFQNERRNYSYYNATVHKLFQIFPPVPDLKGPSSNKCRTCAVVGNSVNLKGSHYGPLIDFQDIVIRMNFAKIKGYENDVGTRTTHRVMYPESAVDLDNSTHLVLFPFKILDIEWAIKATTSTFYNGSHKFMKPNIKVNRDLVMVVNPAFMKYSHVVWLGKKGRYPSTGFMTFILALHICDEIHVFGYGADHKGNWSHYFEVLKNKKLRTGQHPGQHEYNILKQMAEEKTIQFYTGR